MKVVIIDSGVSKDLYNLGELLIDINLSDNQDLPPVDGHGSICAAIIKKYSSSLIGSIRVINKKEQRGSVDKLIEAITWCIDNNIDVVHMSIGSTEICDKEKLQKVICRGLAKGCIFVSALSNKHAWSYPACFSGVIGVKANPLLKNNEYILSGHKSIDFEANSVHKVQILEKLVIETHKSNSYAAPVITGHICNILEDTTDHRIESIRQELAKWIGSKTNKKYQQVDFISNYNISGNKYRYTIIKDVKNTIFDDEKYADCYGVIYDGILKQNIYDKIKGTGIIVWDRSHIKKKIASNNNGFSIPCINIIDDSIYSYEVGRQLSLAFSQRAYSCLCITDKIEGLLYSFTVLENDVEIEELIKEYDYSVIIVCSGYTYDSDVVLRIEDDLCYFEYSEDIVKLDIDDFMYEKIVTLMESHFEGVNEI